MVELQSRRERIGGLLGKRQTCVALYRRKACKRLCKFLKLLNKRLPFLLKPKVSCQSCEKEDTRRIQAEQKSSVKYQRAQLHVRVRVFGQVEVTLNIGVSLDAGEMRPRRKGSLVL